uniref:Inter-alpha-trypsin inhibitor heavy chain n=4 Tax=Rhizophora mucronata TaxID=61149 RepID=A0A2P2KSB9_RHIMU
MAGQFEASVEYGLKLSKRIFYGKELTPAPAPAMSRMPESYLPTAVMVYAVVPEPEAVDNPDVPSYQPYVHGRCEPPAMIPLHMHGVAVEVDCCLDYASISVSGTWRVHCIMTSRKCDCRVAVPMGDQGSLLGVEVDVAKRSWHSQLITAEDAKEKEKISKGGEGRYMKGSIYTFQIPRVEGGSTISIRVTWSQKLSYNKGKFSLSVPFSFPSFVNPTGQKISKREKILLNVDSGTGREIVCKSNTHALKELRRDISKMGFLYESEVMKWSSSNFSFSYSLASNELFGGMLLQSPLLQDFDDRQIFCFYLFPGHDQRWKAFRKELIFLIDISGSMKGPPLESVKNALLASLSKLNPQDSFNIIAFNGETYSFSSLMEPATQEAILKATQWLNNNLLPDGGTNILLPIKQAFKLLADASDSIPLIFLVTDGAVEDEKEICNFVKDSLAHGQSVSPRICTFGIGTYCNHYFLQMLAQIGRGHFDSAYDADSVDFQMQRLFTTASSVILANVSADAFKCLDSLELFPSGIPDLSLGSPLILSGRYTGNFPDLVKINGTLADMGNFVMDLKVQKAKDFPVDMVLARRQIDALTTKAWLSESNDLKEKVAKVSIQTRVPSEYTRMILFQADRGEKAPETILVRQVANRMNPLKQVDKEGQKIICLGSLGVGLGNMIATAKNVPPGSEEGRPLEATEKVVKAASKCCSRLLDRCCCMCFIQTCSYMNDQCSIVVAQLCGALACFECLACCYELFG